MLFLKVLLIVVEVICCLLITGLVLLQKSKSEGLGMAFGAGAGESLFGARAGNVLSKATVIIGIVFMVNTLVLGMLFAQKERLIMDPNASAPVAQPASIQEQPVDLIDLVDPGTEPVAEPIAVPAAEEQDEM